MKNMRDIIGARDKCLSFVGIREGSRRSCQSVAVASSVVQGSANLFSFPDALQGGGDVLMYVTWYELVEFLMALITLAFVIMSYVNSNSKKR